MKKFTKILYATDFSESSAPAAEYARYLAGLTGASIHAIHVIGELTDSRRSMIQQEHFGIFEKEVEIQAIKDMEEFCREKFGEAVAYVTEIVIGKPFDKIIKKAESTGCDLIVMGTHGRTGIEHVIVGSTAERVVRRSKIPVLTVRQTT
ncbi:universal stress protein [Trichloromonas sp.]|uniref:universal stress protein n=1 Tax=Trichloromonas sp. TaxID=3069249 RepID=UPI003D8194F5